MIKSDLSNQPSSNGLLQNIFKAFNHDLRKYSMRLFLPRKNFAPAGSKQEQKRVKTNLIS